MIEIRNLYKRFDQQEVLSNTSLTIPDGAVYGLVGPNGAGKSTLIRCLCGIYRPDQGTILADGQNVYENEIIKQKMCLIPDEWYYPVQASIQDMKKLYMGIYHSFSENRYEKIREMLGLDDTKQIRHMSKGMQKQVAFLLTLSCMPEYMILDEPVDGLDPVMRRQMWSILMGDVAERGMTVLVSSHNLRELEDVCDHVGILNKGKVLLERSLSELQDNTVKLQVAFEGETPNLSEQFHVLYQQKTGRVCTYIMRGNQTEIQQKMAEYKPLLMDILPLTLEEIFIYELGGAGYEIQNISCQ